MQNLKNKIPVLIALLMLFTVQVAKGQDNDSLLKKAASLFEAKRYTQSLALYHQLFSEQQAYTPQMLLKMVFINEGLGDFSKALYYLNVYYLKTSDKEVLLKMEDLAEKHKLSGYQFTDVDFFLNYYHKYLPALIFLGLVLCLSLLVFLVYQKKKSRKLVFPGIGLLLALVLLAYMNNVEAKHPKGIINNGTAYLMNGPSSGAAVVDIVKEGHRVNILGRKDVWVKINWNGSPAYIRENQLMELE